MAALCACTGAPKPSGITLSNLDTTASPRTDFYRYATGGWQKNNPLPAEFARYGTFDKLAQDNVQQIKELIAELSGQAAAADTVAGKIALLYNVGMDSVTLCSQGALPVRPLLETIAGITTQSDLQAVIAGLHKKGITPFFQLFAEADFSDSKTDIGWLYQSGLGLGDRDYYIDSDSRTKNIREEYKKTMSRLFHLAACDEMTGMDAGQLAEKTLAIETRLAAAQMSRHDQRDPYKMFNKKTTEELYALSPVFDFAAYFSALGLPDMDSLNVAQPAYITLVGTVLKEENLEALKAYLAWNVINMAAEYLSDDFINEHFHFYGAVLSGTKELQPRWKRVVNTVNGALGEAVGQLYVAKYFPPAAKEKMSHLVANLQTTLGERIKSATWMNEATKAKALEKLSAFRVKIGYPDKWRDYSALELKADSYFANIIRSNEFENAYAWSKINKPKDVDEWGMTPQTVNAYYNPTTNEICFPAGILQPPFFFAGADNAVNYGAIGVVIGHEMSHGFDDQGRQYDRYGNLQDWWQPEDAENFKQRAQILSDCFDSIEVAPGVHADGKFTLGENIADNGGLQIAFQAMQKARAEGGIAGEMDGFTPAQRFFIAYAGVWAANITGQEILRRTKEDPHALGKWRVNGTLPHVEAFLEAFDVQPGDAMYLDPDRRAVIW
ncbi:MAG: M13 family metallopeptidase [Prevotellaceae bacterium]|nr:M13 family metallopeptidase [Prevotellaceae bacterium]